MIATSISQRTFVSPFHPVTDVERPGVAAEPASPLSPYQGRANMNTSSSSELTPTTTSPRRSLDGANSTGNCVCWRLTRPQVVPRIRLAVTA